MIKGKHSQVNENSFVENYFFSDKDGIKIINLMLIHTYHNLLSKHIQDEPRFYLQSMTLNINCSINF